MLRLCTLSPCPLYAVCQMSGIAAHLAAVYLVERLHSRVQVHPPEQGRIARMAVCCKHLSHEILAQLAPYAGKVNRWVVNAGVAPVNDACQVTGRGIKEHVLSVEI